MSWLDENVTGGSTFTGTGADPTKFTPGYWAAVKANNPTYYNSLKDYDPAYQAEQKAAADADAAAGLASRTSAAAAVNAGPAPIPDSQLRADALNKLSASFGGDPNSLVSSSLADPVKTSIFDTQRSKASDFIGNLLKRGVVTPSGQSAGLTALDTQAPGVRTKLNDIGNLLLEQERGKIRGIYGEGAQAAGQVTTGSNFDPNSYLARANQSVEGFKGTLPDALASQAGTALFDTSGLTASSGAVSGAQSGLDFDPYAGAGGKLNTGLTEGAGTATKRRSTAVF